MNAFDPLGARRGRDRRLDRGAGLGRRVDAERLDARQVAHELARLLDRLERAVVALHEDPRLPQSMGVLGGAIGFMLVADLGGSGIATSPPTYTVLYRFAVGSANPLIRGTDGALLTASERYHVWFVAFALVFQIIWVVSLFDVLG